MKLTANKKIWCFAAILAVLLTIVAAIPFSAFAEKAESVTVYMSVSNKGVLAQAKDGSAMAWKEVTVTDKNEDGKLTFDEALLCAHESYSPNGASDYDPGDNFALKVWGIDNGGSFFFNINNVSINNGICIDTVKAGDYLSVCIMADKESWTDVSNVYFDTNRQTVEVNKAFTLTLSGEKYGLEKTGLSGIDIGIWKDGSFQALTDKKTDADGKVTLSFDQSGTYIVTAKGTYNVDTTDCTVMAPTCIVTVEDALTVNPTQVENLPVGGTKQLTAGSGNITWSSSDESVAAVDENGIITGVAAGTATITAALGTKTATCNVTVTQYKTYAVTAPADAKVSFYYQSKNYVVKKVTDCWDNVEVDGKITHLLYSTSNIDNSYTFRGEMSGKVTQAGYCAAGGSIDLSFDEENVTDTTSDLAYDNKSLLLNVGTTNPNELSIGKDETFKLRCLRTWQIVNSLTANKMIEPEFHYEVLSGGDCIDISPVTESTEAGMCNGNAVNNWLNITGKKEGTALVAVYYDAIHIYNTDFAGIYGATEPSRYAYVLIHVGGTDTAINWNIAYNNKNWDYEINTFYYTGEYGNFAIRPETTDDSTIESVSVYNLNGLTKGEKSIVTAGEGGSYNVPVTAGTNIIEVQTTTGIDYKMVRAAKVSYTMTNNTTGKSAANAAPIMNAGDSITFKINENLYLPIPKLSGIYNPQVTVSSAYLLDGTTTISSVGTGAQSAFSSTEAARTYTFTAGEVGEHQLSGYIVENIWGDVVELHRGLTDAGKAVNTQAAAAGGNFSWLPEISFNVVEPADDITVNTSIAVSGDLKMIEEEVTAKDINKDGRINVDEVLSAAHETACAESYASAETEYGLAITKLWNDESGAYGYWLNNGSCLSLDVEVKDGDYLYAFVYADKTDWSDAYACFDQHCVTAGKTVIASLKKAGYDDNWQTVFSPCAGAAIKVYDENKTVVDASKYMVTDLQDGTYKIVFQNTGTFYVTASKSDNSITPAVMQVVVDADLAAAEDAESKIDAIGEVTLAKETAIQDARTTYDALTNAQKEKVKNLSTLINAETKLAELKADQQAAQNVIDQINAIGNVTLASETTVKNVRSVYDALTAARKALISDDVYKILTAAESKIADLKAVNAVEVLIDQISANITIDTTETEAAKVLEARTAYQNLTDTQKSMIDATKKAKLETAEGTLKDTTAAGAVRTALNDTSVDDVTFENDTKLQKAKKAIDLYTALSNDAKSYLTDEEKAKAQQMIDKYTELCKNINAAKETTDKIERVTKCDVEEMKVLQTMLDQYDRLTENEKAHLDTETKSKMERLVNEAKAVNCKTDQVKISSDLPWNVRVQSPELNEVSDAMKKEINNETVLFGNEIKLQLFNGDEWTDGDTNVTFPLNLTFTIEQLSDYTDIRVLHEKANGEIEYPTVTVNGNKVSFEVDSLSPFVVTGKAVSTQQVSGSQQDSSPNTGIEGDNLAAVFALLMCSAALLVVLRKRNAQ